MCCGKSCGVERRHGNDGRQGHDVLHRRIVGRALGGDGDRCDQSRDRATLRQGRTRHQSGCRPRRCCGPRGLPGVRRVVARGTPGAARKDRRHLQAPLQRDGRDHQPRDGGSALLRDAVPGRRRHGPLPHSARHPQNLRLRGAARRHRNPARADRRHRHDHAVELASQSDLLQGRRRARSRLHDGAEALGSRAVLGDPDRGDAGGSGRAGGCLQSRARRQGRRPGDG